MPAQAGIQSSPVCGLPPSRERRRKKTGVTEDKVRMMEAKASATEDKVRMMEVKASATEDKLRMMEDKASATEDKVRMMEHKARVTADKVGGDSGQRNEAVVTKVRNRGGRGER